MTIFRALVLKCENPLWSFFFMWHDTNLKVFWNLYFYFLNSIFGFVHNIKCLTATSNTCLKHSWMMLIFSRVEYRTARTIPYSNVVYCSLQNPEIDSRLVCACSKERVLSLFPGRGDASPWPSLLTLSLSRDSPTREDDSASSEHERPLEFWEISFLNSYYTRHTFENRCVF